VAELDILQNYLLACLFQSSGQIEEPEGHCETFANRVGRVDKQYTHGIKNLGIRRNKKLRNILAKNRNRMKAQDFRNLFATVISEATERLKSKNPKEKVKV
jgi:hypothetical protein